MFTKKAFPIFFFFFLATVFCQNLSAQPVNDNPCGAIELVAIEGQNCTPQTPYNWTGATASPNIPAPGCASYTTGDVWFKFTLAVKSDVFITTVAGVGGGAITDGGMAVYSATACDGTFTKIKCDDDTGPGSMPQIQITLNPGEYFVRFWDYADKTAANFGGICLATKAILVAAPNDDPCQAIALPIVAADSCAPANPFSWEGATASSVAAPLCGSYSTGDIWFKFSLTDTANVDISTLAGVGGGAITDAAMVLYSANACDGALTEIVCNNNYGNNPMPRIKRGSMLPGTYYLRFWDVFDKTAGNIGGICVAATTPDFSPALNDEPCDAVELSVAAADVCIPQNPYSWGFATATANFATPTCGSYSTGDIWFKFSLAAASDVFITTKEGAGAGAITDGAMALYKADQCNGSFSTIACDDESGPGSMPQISEFALPAGQYFVRFWDYQDNPGGNIGGICVTGKPTASTAPNDLCITASPFPNIPVDGNCASVEVNTTGATGSTQNNCGAIADDDVWYSFVVPQGHQKLAYAFTQNGIPSTQGLRIYSGSCGQLVSVACVVGAEGILQNLSPGQTYFARTYTVAQGDGGAAYSFCLSAIVPPANDDPCGASVLPVVQNANSCLPNNPISWQFATATQGIPVPGCGSYSTGDIWFKFLLGEQSEVSIKTAAGFGPKGITDGAMALYYANGCNGLTKIICNDDETPQQTMPALHNITLIPGEYYIRFWRYDDQISGNIGGICVSASPSISNHENELCVSATPFPAIPVDGSCARLEINTAHATGLFDVALPGIQDDDLWYQFSTPVGVTKLWFDTEFLGGNQQLMLLIYDACGKDSPIQTIGQEKSGLIEGLAENTSYWLRVYTFETGVSAHFELCLSALLPPANDLCSSPAQFPLIPEDGAPATAEVAYQWAKNTSYSCGNSEGGDVWFQFVVPNNTTSLMAGFDIPPGSDASPRVEVLSGPCNNLISISCLSNDYFTSLRINGLTPGASYLLRASASKNDFGPYSLTLRVPPPPPANDLCANAIAFPLIPINGDCAQIVANTRGATGDNSDECAGIFDDDVWYTFTVPMGYTQLFATQKSMAGSDISALAIYSGVCNNLTLVSCRDNSDSLLVGLVEGQTYFMRVYSLYANEEAQVEICLRVPSVASQPNDHCPDALAFPPISTDGSWSTVTGSTLAASPSGLPTCDGYADDDVWYAFVMPLNYDKLIYDLEVIGGFNNAGLIVELYAGHCGNLEFMGCYNDGESSHFAGLVGGQAYFLRVFSQSPQAHMDFSIGLRVPEGLKNDLCENAIAFPDLPKDGSCVNVHGNTALATGVIDPWCNGAEDDDIWYSFTVPEDRTSVNFDLWTNFGNRAQLITYAGTCDNLLPMECLNQSYIDDISVLQPNQTYYIRVFSHNTNVSTDFDLCLSMAPAPPVNDHCADALSITNSTGAFEDPGLQTLKGATLSYQPICAQYTGEMLPFDVWYSFTTDQNGGNALISLQALEDIPSAYFGYWGLGMQAFSGDCAGFSTLWCGGDYDNNLYYEMPLYGLAGGTTYYFRVFGLTTTGGYAPQDFLISAQGTAFQPVSQSKAVERSGLQSELSITKVFPSPAQSQLTVTFEAIEAGPCQLMVFDLAGRLLENISLEAQEGFNRQTMEVGHLPAGMYVGQLSTANQKPASFRFVKAE